MSEFRRKVEWSAAYDKRSPEPGKNYGIHGMEVRFLLMGEGLTIQFLVYTNWHLKHVQDEMDRRLDSEFPHLSCHPLPADIGYHSTVPVHEDQEARAECPWLDGQTCYYDGSSLNAERVYWKFVEGGEPALWAEMEEWYRDIKARTVALAGADDARARAALTARTVADRVKAS